MCMLLRRFRRHLYWKSINTRRYKQIQTSYKIQVIKVCNMLTTRMKHIITYLTTNYLSTWKIKLKFKLSFSLDNQTLAHHYRNGVKSIVTEISISETPENTKSRNKLNCFISFKFTKTSSLLCFLKKYIFKNIQQKDHSWISNWFYSFHMCWITIYFE